MVRWVDLAEMSDLQREETLPPRLRAILEIRLFRALLLSMKDLTETLFVPRKGHATYICLFIISNHFRSFCFSSPPNITSSRAFQSLCDAPFVVCFLYTSLILSAFDLLSKPFQLVWISGRTLKCFNLQFQMSL
jgi:hypothetical protein